jgi:hypothetical protein
VVVVVVVVPTVFLSSSSSSPSAAAFSLPVMIRSLLTVTELYSTNFLWREIEV